MSFNRFVVGILISKPNSILLHSIESGNNLHNLMCRLYTSASSRPFQILPINHVLRKFCSTCVVEAHVVRIDKNLDSANTGVVRVIVDNRDFPFLWFYGRCQSAKSPYMKHRILTGQSRYYHRASEKRSEVLVIALEELDYFSSVFVSRAHS